MNYTRRHSKYSAEALWRLGSDFNSHRELKIQQKIIQEILFKILIAIHTKTFGFLRVFCAAAAFDY